MELTQHAAKRLQQRALPPLVIDLLYRYGREQHQAGATVLFFDEKGRRKAREELKNALKRFDKLEDAYLVELAIDGRIVTAGHRNRRINRR